MNFQIAPGDGIVGELELLGELIIGGFPDSVFTLVGVNVDEVLDAGRLYDGFGADASAAAVRVRSLQMPEFVGVEGEFFRGRVPVELAGQLDAASESYGRVGTAIRGLARELDGGQTALRPLESRARAVFEHMQAVWVKVNFPFTEYSRLRGEWDELVRAATAVHERVAAAGQAAATEITAGTEVMARVNEFFSALPGGAVVGGAAGAAVRSTASRAVSSTAGALGTPGRGVKAAADGLAATAGVVTSVPEKTVARGQQLAAEVTPDGIRIGDVVLTDPTSDDAQKLVRDGLATNVLGLDPTGVPTAMMMLASPSTLMREQPRKGKARRWASEDDGAPSDGERNATGIAGQIVSVPGRFVGGLVDRAGNTVAGNAALIGVGGDPVRAWTGLAGNVLNPVNGVTRGVASATPAQILKDPIAAAGATVGHAPAAIPFVGWAYGLVELAAKPGELARSGAKESIESSLDEATKKYDAKYSGHTAANTGTVQVTTGDVDVHADNGGYVTFTLPDLEGGEPKAWYIMATPDSPGNFTTEVPHEADEELVERGDGSVVLVNSTTGQNVRTVKTPWAKDALGRDQPTWYSVEKVDSKTSTITQHIQPNRGALYPLIADAPDYGTGADGKQITVDKLPNGQEVVHENGTQSVIGNPNPGEERAAPPPPKVNQSQTYDTQTSTADNGNGTTTVTTTNHQGQTSTRTAPTAQVDNALGQRADNERQRQQDINSRLRGPNRPAPAQDLPSQSQESTRDETQGVTSVDSSWSGVTNPRPEPDTTPLTTRVGTAAKDTFNGARTLVGAGGEGAPGVGEAWKELGKGVVGWDQYAEGEYFVGTGVLASNFVGFGSLAKLGRLSSLGRIGAHAGEEAGAAARAARLAADQDVHAVALQIPTPPAAAIPTPHVDPPTVTPKPSPTATPRAAAAPSAAHTPAPAVEAPKPAFTLTPGADRRVIAAQAAAAAEKIARATDNAAPEAPSMPTKVAPDGKNPEAPTAPSKSTPEASNGGQTPSSGVDKGQAAHPVGNAAMPGETPRPQPDREFTVTGKDVPRGRKAFAARGDLEPNAVYRVDGRGDFYTGPDGKVNFVETTYGNKGKLNADLQKPQPNATYVVHPQVSNPADGVSNAHIFQTDGRGRVTFAHTESLQPGDAYRSSSVTTRVGNIGGKDYEGGHTFGKFFGGGTEVANLDPMLRAVNRGSGRSFGNLEGYWRGLLNSPTPPKIEVAIEKIFEGGNKVPTKFIVDYRIDGGRPMTETFENVR